MFLGLTRRSFESASSSPPIAVEPAGDGNVDGKRDNNTAGSDRQGRLSDHRRSASSSDATPRPRAALPHVAGPFLDPNYTTLQGHNADTDILSSEESFLSNTSRQHQQQPSKRLGFFTSNTSSFSKTSPSQPTHRIRVDSKERSHSHSRSDITAHQDILVTNMTSVPSSTPVNSKVHASPTKLSTRTYDAKLVTREMHRLGTLAGLNPSLTTTSLSSNASTSTLTLAQSTAPSTTTLVAATSHSHGMSALSSATTSEKDNPWGTLHVHVLPLFNEEPLRIPIEDLNALVRRHIQTVLAASPSKALTTLATDARELIGAGTVTMNAKLVGLTDELLPSRLVELWSFFWDHVLPYVEGVLLPLQTDPLLTSLHRTAKQHRASSPARQGAKVGTTISSLSALSPTIDVRSVALCAFRDRVVVPLHSRLHTLLSPPLSKETLIRLGPYRQPRLQQLLLVLTSERRVRPPSPTISLRAPEVQPNAGEAAIADLLRLLSQAQHLTRAQVPHHVPRQSFTHGLTVRAATPNFLSAGIPRDRRGRIGGHDVKRMILSAEGWSMSMLPSERRDMVDGANGDTEDEGGNEGNETPRLGRVYHGDRREASSAQVEQQQSNSGGWGLGAGNEEREVDDDDDEAMNWDQAQAAVERMIGMKSSESPTDSRRRVLT